jgi:hypothetical protein
MGIFDKSVKKKLMGDLKDAIKDYEKKAKELFKLYDERNEIGKDYEKAKNDIVKFINKEFGGEAQYNAAMKLFERKQAPPDMVEKLTQVNSLNSIAMKLVDPVKAVAMDDARVAALKGEAARNKAIDEVRRCKAALEDYLDEKAKKKADSSKEGKQEYARWKKELRADLFAT